MTIPSATAERCAGLRRMLEDHLREMQDQVRHRIRGVRADGPTDVLDAGENGDADRHEDIEFTLIQMRGDVVRRVNEALRRLGAGEYGSCCDCKSEIAESRLRALPFAVRCAPCEGRREQMSARQRRATDRRGGAALFSELPE